MRKLITFFVNRPVWGNAFIAIVIIFGVFALSTTKKSYVEIVSSTNQFTQEAETLLKEAIASTKTGFSTL